MNIFKKISLALVLLLVVGMAASCNLGDHQHSLSKVDKIDATCTQAGQEAYYACDSCDAIFADINGKKTLEAPVVIEALGHLLSGVAGTEATCTEGGVADCYKCTRCETLFADAKAENVITSPETTSPKGHDLVKTEAKAVSCTENGNEAYWSCSSCGKLFADAEGQNETALENVIIKSNGHSLVKTEAKAVSCEADGNIAYWSCENCGKLYSDEAGESEIALADTVIKSEGHSYGATLTVSGAVTEYEPGDSFDSSSLEVKMVCLSCGNTATVSGYSISKTDNLQPEDSEIVISYVEGGVTYTATIKITVKHVHTTGDLVPAKAPTCVATGTLAYYECTACHEKFEDKAATKPIEDITVGTIGHAGVKTEAKAASCSEAGNNAYWTCQTCGGVFADEGCTVSTTVEAETIPATNHSEKVVADNDGHWIECDNCDYATSKEPHSGVAYPDARPECDVCGAEFGEASWDGWVHYAPGVVYADYYERIQGTVDGTSNINYELSTDENGMNVTKFTVAAGTSANSAVAVWNDQNLLHNIKVPVRQNGTKVIAFITNHGTQDITVTVGQVDSSKDMGSGTVLVPAGETASVKFAVTSGAAKGNNTWFAVRDDVESDTVFSVWGYFNVEDDVKSLNIKTPASKLVFNVGETFSAEGLRLNIAEKNAGASADYGEFDIYSNYVTDFDGRVFTASDIGTHTVTVSFAGATATYTIVVENAGHTHNIVYVGYKAATCFEDGNLAHYVCDGEGCGQLFADENGNSPIVPEDVRIASSHMPVQLPGYAEYCARCGEVLGDEVMSGEHWVLFRPEIEVGSGSFPGWKAEYTDVDGVYGSMFTFGAGVNAGDRIKLTMWNEQGQFQTIIPNGIDAAVANRRVVMYYHNYGTEAITIKFENDSNSSIYDEVTIPAGGIIASTFDHPKSGGGSNWFYLQVQNDIQSDVTVGVYGYFYLDSEFNSISIADPADKLNFVEGDTFSAAGLMLKTDGGIKTTFVETGYTTNLDGVVLDKAGKYTVEVTFGGKTVTYEIDVAGHQHQTELVAGRDPIKCEKDGYEAYYRCTVAGCGAIFSDEAASNSISAPVAISAHGKATIANGKVVCSDCMTYGMGDNWVFYNITTNYGANSVVNGRIEAADIDGIPGSMIYIGAGTVGGQGANFQLCMSSNDADRQTVIPNLGDKRPEGALRHVLVFYKNYGTEDVTLNLQNDASGGNGSVTIPAGGTAVSAFDIRNVGGSNWFNLYIDSNVNVDTQIGAYGYIYIHDGESEIKGIKNAATKTEFKVGDTFSAEGLILEAKIPSSNTMTLHISSGYTTSLDGVVFDAAGSYTVEVYFAGAKIEYTVTVSE